jgi:hypothetical protein
MLTPTATGYVNVNSLNPVLVGAWYAYGDNLGNNGFPPGNCQMKGGHMDSQCSMITSPAPSDAGLGFPQTTPGTMCLSGTAAKVIAGEGGTDYSNIFGIGIGLDLNNMGGTKGTYNTTMAKIAGFEFTVAGLPTGTVRVEFPTPATDPSGDAWSYTLTGDGDTTVMLTAGTGGQLIPSFNMTGQPAFDATMVESIQFHVVTSTSGAVMVNNFCISNLAAIVCM